MVSRARSGSPAPRSPTSPISCLVEPERTSADYAALWDYSTPEPADFWGAIADYFQIRWHDRPTDVLPEAVMPGAAFEPGQAPAASSVGSGSVPAEPGQAPAASSVGSGSVPAEPGQAPAASSVGPGSVPAEPGQAPAASSVWFPGGTLNYAEHALAGPVGRLGRRPGGHRGQPRTATEQLLTSDELTAAGRGRPGGTAPAGCGPPATGWSLWYRTPCRPWSPSSLPPRSARSGRPARPDFGAPSVIDRFTQISPTVLIAVDGYRYGGKAILGR